MLRRCLGTLTLCHQVSQASLQIDGCQSQGFQFVACLQVLCVDNRPACVPACWIAWPSCPLWPVTQGLPISARTTLSGGCGNSLPRPSCAVCCMQKRRFPVLPLSVYSKAGWYPVPKYSVLFPSTFSQPGRPGLPVAFACAHCRKISS